MNYLLDTNICVAIIRRKSSAAANRLTAQAVGSVGISVVTEAELHYGAEKSADPPKNLLALEQFLLPLVVVDFDSQAAACYGKLRADLESKGTVIGSMDLLIGAHALSLKIALVTNNTREFSRVPGLPLEDWTTP